MNKANKMKVDMDSLSLSEEAFDALSAMAEEQEVSMEELVEKLIFEEDRRRHVKREPFVGDVRVKCLAFHSRCKEKLERVGEPEELGG